MKKYLLLTLPILLAACAPHGDLRAWMEQTKQNAANSVPKPKPVEPPVYMPYEPPEFFGLNAFDASRDDGARFCAELRVFLYVSVVKSPRHEIPRLF